MPPVSCLCRLSFLVVIAGTLLSLPCLAQQPQGGPGPATARPNPQQAQAPAQQQTAPPAPSLMDPAGPTVSLETSEAMFDVAVALNACGYDKGLNESDPVRKHVRDEVNQATKASADARDARDRLCLFIDQHRLEDPSRDLAQYVSLALYLTPPPELTPSVDEQDLPPDASGVELVLPLLRRFVWATDLHVIWVENRPAYDEATNQLHGPLSAMIVSTDYYLKIPASTFNGRRFLVVLEPMLSPEETNARVYGSDYVVVASPRDGHIYMQLVRHAYLHYQIEPLLYQREDSLDRMLPILRTLDDAPLEFTFKSDIVALVIECMIKAIEARTMDTGVPVVKVPANLTHSEAVPYEEARSAALEKITAIRQQTVNHDMTQGYVLTQYFYNQMIAFEKSPESLDQAIGPMVYGMDVSAELHQAKQITFDQQGEGDMMTHVPPQPKGLDLAEMKLMKGDVTGASQIAQQALETHTGDAGQAYFILARADLMNGRINDAQAAFGSALATSKDPRTLAWSHIYLGRILDVEDQREDAVAEYKAALTVRDGQPDTKRAAESGLKQPFTLPHQAQADSDSSEAPKTAASQPHPDPR